MFGITRLSPMVERIVFVVLSTIALLLIILALHTSIYNKGLKAGQALCAAEVTEARREWMVGVEAERAKSRKDKDEALKKLDLRVGDLMRQLRNRPPRPTEPASAASQSSGAGSTGAGLHREDAEFLAGEAAAATRLQEALLECRRGYGPVKQ
jgi:hypothetical protein